MYAIQVTRSSMPLFEEYMNEIKYLWTNRWLTNMGVKHKQLKREVSSYLHAQNLTLFANDHLALECAIEALDLIGELVTTPFTFASNTNAIIVRQGLVQVFCNINKLNTPDIRISWKDW